MSQGRRPMLGAVGGSYMQPGGQYMSQQMPVGPGSNPGPPHQRFMMMSNHMYGQPASQSPMYMTSSQQQPGPSPSPVGRPLTPQQPQLQHLQNMVQSSPSQLSPVPSVSSDHGLSSHENNTDDPSGDNSRSSTGVPQPSPSPVGSAGSRSNTPASISGARSGSPMPIRPPSGQIDGQSRFTQSPMATQGFGQHIMPPPNSMAYMPTPGKIGGTQMPGHMSQYGSQFPQGNYNRQPNMATSGPAQTSPMQAYPGSQANMYSGSPNQMPGAAMYGSMPGMVRNMGQQAYNPSPGAGPYGQSNTSMAGMMNNHYPGYNAHMGPMAGHHGMQQTPGAAGHLPSGSALTSAMGGQPGGMMSSNKGGMLTAAGSVGPRMSHNRGSMSPSRGMFMQSGEGPLAHVNNMMNSQNVGSSNVNMNSVEQSTRSGPVQGNVSTSTSSPVPHFSAGLSNPSSSIVNSGDHSNSQTSPLPSAEAHDSVSRPGSVVVRHPDLPSDSAIGSDSSGGMPSDSTSVDSGFHSSDQSDKTSDSVSTPTQSGSSPPLSCHPTNGDSSRTLENISPPDHTSHPQHHLQHHHHLHQQHMQQQHYMDPEPKMPYMSDSGVPVPPAAMSLMPSSSSSVVTTANAGPSLTSVTQSIASPVASISTSIPSNHPHSHHMGPHGGVPHMMGHGIGPGPLGMMTNGMPAAGMVNPGPTQMRPNMGAAMPGMMPANLAGPNMNVNQNGPVMGPMMSHNGPMLSGHLGGMNSTANNTNMIPMGQMSAQQQMNCMPAMGGGSTKASSKSTSDETTPGKKKKLKDSESQGGQRAAGSVGLHYSEEPNSPGALKNASDVNKLFEMGPEPDRRHFLERIFAFLEESGQPVTALPVISKTPLDLYKLYFSVKEKGGFEEITRSKKWRDICTAVNIGTSASAAFTLKKNYIRYLFNYECKFDRGGINPAPILAQMEAQLAHKREQKRRAPSPAGSNSNDSFRPPSVPNSQIDSPYQPANMPPPYMQNPDGSLSEQHVAGNMMMGSNSMMAGPGSHGGMMAGAPAARPGMMSMSGAGMMHRQQGMIPNAGTGSMMGSQMPGGPPGYGGPMMQQPMSLSSSSGVSGPPFPSHGGLPAAVSMPASSDTVTAQDPFAVDSGYLQPRAGGNLQGTPPPQPLASVTSTPLVSSYPGVQASTMGNTALTSTSSQSGPASAGFPAPDQIMSGFLPNSGQPSEPPVSTTSSGQLNYGQQFERSDRFEQLARPSGPAAAAVMPPSQPTSTQHPPIDGSSAYSGTRFQSVGLRPPGGEVSGSYPQPGSAYQNQTAYPGPQYPGYPQNTVGPRPPPGSGGIYGTPTKRFPDDQPDRIREGQWSPMQRSHVPQNGPVYMSVTAPGTPSLGQHCQQMNHKNSPHGRDSARYLGQQKALPTHGGMAVASFARKEVTFPPDCIESLGISTTKRKKLTSKDLAPFESWRLMMALKSGLLAESTWALDTLNILLYDDSTVGYFGLNTLPGLLEVLADHLRHCLMQMFPEFEDLEEGLVRKHISHNTSLKSSALLLEKSMSAPDSSELEGAAVLDERKPNNFVLSSANYTMMSRKGMPVKIDSNPADSSVLDAKDWDVFCNCQLKPDVWATGCGDITKHILSHLESGSTHTFLSSRFQRKRTRQLDSAADNSDVSFVKEKKNCPSGNILGTASAHVGGQSCLGTCSTEKHKSLGVKCEEPDPACVVTDDMCLMTNDSRLSGQQFEDIHSIYNGNMCKEEDTSAGFGSLQTQQGSGHTHLGSVDVSKSNSTADICDESDGTSKFSSKNAVKDKNKVSSVQDGKIQTQKDHAVTSNIHQNELGHPPTESTDTNAANAHLKKIENGDIEEPRLSPVLRCEQPESASADRGIGLCESNTRAAAAANACSDNCSNSSPPVLRAVSLDGDDDDDFSVNEAAHQPMNSADNGSSTASLNADLNPVEASSCGKNTEIKVEEDTEESQQNEKDVGGLLNEHCGAGSMDVSHILNDSFTSESEELSASVVAEILKDDEHLEDEAFQRDDAPLCTTPESQDELGRRCVCISNIIRSLSCIPGNEELICKHAGTMRVLARLLLLHHHHPVRPAARHLPRDVDEEEEEREQPPRVYDDEHWWWDYLDQLRENALVIMANICSHLKLANFPEQICFPLLEGLLHWVICPASVARDPLPTLPVGCVLSPQRLVLEALCKLCIHETNVDLLLATPPVKRILELFSVLVRLLADRSHQITREFSIVLLSLLVSGESSTARAVALQHACVSLLVDFIETAEQNALAIANQQGIEVLQVNPEIMGTSLDMLRRAASILLHMARVPDNHKLFVQQQNRLLNLVMSQILDQSVSSTLSEVLFECSQVS